MERLTERIDNVPDGESGIWVKEHDYVSAAEKLAEYEDLEEQGRLIKLPCKVGDTVYFIKNSETIVKRKADMIFIGIFWEEFGKKWFPTREEAEAKLKELRGKNE